VVAKPERRYKNKLSLTWVEKEEEADASCTRSDESGMVAVHSSECCTDQHCR